MKTNTATLAQTGNFVVAVYASHEQAEAAAKALNRRGLDMTKVSIVGKDYHTKEQVSGFYGARGEMEELRKLGEFWGGLCGSMFGSVVFLIPGVGPIILAGPLTTRVMEAAGGSGYVGGFGIISAALESTGIRGEPALRYATQLQDGRFVLIVHGSAGDVQRATAVLEMSNHMEVNEYGNEEALNYEPW